MAVSLWIWGVSLLIGLATIARGRQIFKLLTFPYLILMALAATNQLFSLGLDSQYLIDWAIVANTGCAVSSTFLALIASSKKHQLTREKLIHQMTFASNMNLALNLGVPPLVLGISSYTYWPIPFNYTTECLLSLFVSLMSIGVLEEAQKIKPLTEPVAAANIRRNLARPNVAIPLPAAPLKVKPEVVVEVVASWNTVQAPQETAEKEEKKQEVENLAENPEETKEKVPEEIDEKKGQQEKPAEEVDEELKLLTDLQAEEAQKEETNKPKQPRKKRQKRRAEENRPEPQVAVTPPPPEEVKPQVIKKTLTLLRSDDLRMPYEPKNRHWIFPSLETDCRDCRKATANCEYLPCGHVVLCETCAVSRMKAGSNTCTSCQKEVTTANIVRRPTDSRKYHVVSAIHLALE